VPGRPSRFYGVDFEANVAGVSLKGTCTVSEKVGRNLLSEDDELWAQGIAALAPRAKGALYRDGRISEAGKSFKLNRNSLKILAIRGPFEKRV